MIMLISCDCKQGRRSFWENGLCFPPP